jgi:hypothetical protein
MTVPLMFSSVNDVLSASVTCSVALSVARVSLIVAAVSLAVVWLLLTATSHSSVPVTAVSLVGVLSSFQM